MKSKPKNVDFKALKKLLEKSGYECINIGGSHFFSASKAAQVLPFRLSVPLK